MLCLLLPFALWAFVFRDAILGRIVFHGDNIQYSHWVLYFFDNLQQGVFPVWNPFHSWGCIDNLDMRFIGEYNPFLYLIPLLRSLGVSGHAAFTAFMISCFWIGAVGLYTLVYRLFKNPYIACVAYSLLLFSGYGIQFFIFQITDVLITAPLVWFFYFLFSLTRNPRKKYLLGLTLTVMLAETTYIPFLFIIVTGLILTLTLIAYPRAALSALKRIGTLMRGHKILTLFCLIAIIASAVPLVMWRTASLDPQYIVDVERMPQDSRDPSEVSRTTVNSVALSAMTSPAELFDNLDIAHDQVMPFVSVFLYIALLFCALTRMTRRSFILVIAFVLLLMISCGDTFPLHPWLFRRFAFFRIFRNYLFVFPVLICLAIIFLMDRLESLCHSHPISQTSRVLQSLWGLVCFTAIMIFFRQFDHIIITSYATAVISLAVFLLWIWRAPLSKNSFFLILLIPALIQPMEFFSFIIPLFNTTSQDHPSGPACFSLTRPPRGSGFNEAHSFHKRQKLLRDESGFTTGGFYGLRCVRDLHEHLEMTALQDYIRTKFYIYSNWAFVPSGPVPWQDLATSFRDPAAPALIFAPLHGSALRSQPGTARTAITHNSEILHVTSFNVNSIVLDVTVPDERLLVYNDAFHHDWRSTIDGTPAETLRVNYAFKGLLIPAGTHTIIWRFGHPALPWIFWSLLGITFLVWMMTLKESLKHDP